MFALHPTRWLAPYAEGALPTAKAGEVARHVFGCRRCRRELELVRAGRQFAAALLPAMPTTSSGPSWSELARLLDEPAPARARPFRWALAAAAMMVLMTGALLWRAPHLVTAARAAPSLESAALAAHREGRLELRTSDDQVLQRWISDRTGLAMALPPSGDHRRLLGATRLADGALALSYRLGDEPVTLVIAATSPAGDRLTDRKRITHRSDGALEVASWTHISRSYALVSASGGASACALCHATAGPAALL